MSGVSGVSDMSGVSDLGSAGGIVNGWIRTSRHQTTSVAARQNIYVKRGEDE